MATTYEPIASQTLASNTTTVSFSSIPVTYTDLRLLIAGRNSGAVTTRTVTVQLNSDTATNYSTTYLSGNGSAASSSRLSSGTSWQIGNVPGASASSGIFGAMAIDFLSYANTSVNKTALCAYGDQVQWVERIVALWRSTSAITSISVAGASSDFVAGSTFSLYGIRAA